MGHMDPRWSRHHLDWLFAGSSTPEGVGCEHLYVRVGTWNLAGNWSPAHRELLQYGNCDVWLLTEVHDDTEIPGMTAHCTSDPMGPRKTWAGILSKTQLDGRPHPQRATALAHIGGTRFLSSVLPWRSCGPSWAGSTLAEKQALTLDAIRDAIDDGSVWGGDWNQALEGPEHVGTTAGRRRIDELARDARLSVPTRSLGSASPGHRSIDHVAVPMAWDVLSAQRVPAEAEGRRLSDHDAFVVNVIPAPIQP